MIISPWLSSFWWLLSLVLWALEPETTPGYFTFLCDFPMPFENCLSLRPSLNYLNLNVFADMYRNRGILCMTEWLPQWLGSATLPKSSSSPLSSLIREHNSYFWTKPQQQKPGIMALSVYRPREWMLQLTQSKLIQWEHGYAALDHFLPTSLCLAKEGKFDRQAPKEECQAYTILTLFHPIPLLTPYLYTIPSFVVHDWFLDVSLLFLARL